MGGVKSLESLVQSPHRVRLLERLLEESATIDRLEVEFDVHRRTLIRNINNLETLGWVDRQQREYSVAPAVYLFATELFDVIDRLTIASQLVEFFEYVPRNRVDIPITSLENVDVVGSGSDTPHGPLMVVRAVISTAKNVRALAPVLSPLYIELYADTASSGSTVEAVLTSTAAKTILNEQSKSVTHYRQSDAYLSVTDQNLAFGLVITDQCVLVGAYDDGVLRVVIKGNNDELRDWATTVYSQQQSTAQPIEEYVNSSSTASFRS